MAKQRYLNTRFWDDTYITTLDPSEKLLFLYFLSNPLTTISGVYEITLKRMSNDTGFDADTILKILDRFRAANKIHYYEGWVIITNFIKHQNTKSPKITKGIEIDFENIPENIKKYRIHTLSYGIDTLSHSNTNSNINSNTNSNKKNGAKSAGETKKPAEATVGEKTTHAKIKEIFESGSEKLTGVKYRHNAKEAKHVKHLESIYEKNPEEFTLMCNRYMDAIMSGENFWIGKPFTPSMFNSLYNNIVSYKPQKKQVPFKDQSSFLNSYTDEEKKIIGNIINKNNILGITYEK